MGSSSPRIGVKIHPNIFETTALRLCLRIWQKKMGSKDHGGKTGKSSDDIRMIF